MSEEVRRVGRELVYKGAILEVYKDHMEFANGNHADWDYIHHDGAAAVVPVLPDGRILMVSQYRNALERHTLEYRPENWTGRMSQENCVQEGNWKKRPATGQTVWNG